MKKLKVILTSLLVALSLLDCFDTFILSVIKDTPNVNSKTCTTLLAQHHHDQEEMVLIAPESSNQPVEKEQQHTIDRGAFQTSLFIYSIWQPPKAI